MLFRSEKNNKSFSSNSNYENNNLNNNKENEPVETIKPEEVKSVSSFSSKNNSQLRTKKNENKEFNKLMTNNSNSNSMKFNFNNVNNQLYKLKSSSTVMSGGGIVKKDFKNLKIYEEKNGSLIDTENRKNEKNYLNYNEKTVNRYKFLDGELISNDNSHKKGEENGNEEQKI